VEALAADLATVKVQDLIRAEVHRALQDWGVIPAGSSSPKPPTRKVERKLSLVPKEPDADKNGNDGSAPGAT
jgi:hypothetical protein